MVQIDKEEEIYELLVLTFDFQHKSYSLGTILKQRFNMQTNIRSDGAKIRECCVYFYTHSIYINGRHPFWFNLKGALTHFSII